MNRIHYRFKTLNIYQCKQCALSTSSCYATNYYNYLWSESFSHTSVKLWGKITYSLFRFCLFSKMMMILRTFNVCTSASKCYLLTPWLGGEEGEPFTSGTFVPYTFLLVDSVGHLVCNHAAFDFLSDHRKAHLRHLLCSETGVLNSWTEPPTSILTGSANFNLQKK